MGAIAAAGTREDTPRSEILKDSLELVGGKLGDQKLGRGAAGAKDQVEDNENNKMLSIVHAFNSPKRPSDLCCLLA